MTIIDYTWEVDSVHPDDSTVVVKYITDGYPEYAAIIHIDTDDDVTNFSSLVEQYAPTHHIIRIEDDIDMSSIQVGDTGTSAHDTEPVYQEPIEPTPAVDTERHGTTAERPDTSDGFLAQQYTGFTRLNTTTQSFELFDGLNWI